MKRKGWGGGFDQLWGAHSRLCSLMTRCSNISSDEYLEKKVFFDVSFKSPDALRFHTKYIPDRQPQINRPWRTIRYDHNCIIG